MALKILLFGKNGQVGHHLVPVLGALGDLTALGRAEADFAAPRELAWLVQEYAPQVIVNAAAYTDVDAAEAEPDMALRVNAEAVEKLARAAKQVGASLVHYSTDYVFDGAQNQPYTEEDIPNPLNAYGRSKLAGDQAVQMVGGSYLVLRTSWVYTFGFDNFMTRVLEWLHTKEQVRIVSNQVGSPTWARMLAEKTGEILAQAGESPGNFFGERGGLYHLAGSGAASRFQWAQAIQIHDPEKATQLSCQIEAVKGSRFPAAASRPANSALDCARVQSTFGLSLEPWDKHLRQAFSNSARRLV